jgi:hypothetical protein
MTTPTLTMDHDAYADAAAQWVGLPLAADHRPGVLRYLQLAQGMASRVMDFPLGRDDEPANVFHPVAPEDLPEAGS